MENKEIVTDSPNLKPGEKLRRYYQNQIDSQNIKIKMMKENHARISDELLSWKRREQQKAAIFRLSGSAVLVGTVCYDLIAVVFGLQHSSGIGVGQALLGTFGFFLLVIGIKE